MEKTTNEKEIFHSDEEFRNFFCSLVEKQKMDPQKSDQLLKNILQKLQENKEKA